MPSHNRATLDDDDDDDTRGGGTICLPMSLRMTNELRTLEGDEHKHLHERKSCFGN